MKKKMKRVEKFLLDKMKESNLPGLSMAVVEGDSTIYSRGFGRREMASGKAATARTLYGIGSITKSFTCLALMQLQEEGELNIDDPVGRYLDFDIEPGGKTVTIEHLMTHTSGIPGLAYAEAAILNSVGEKVEDVPIGDVDDMLTFMEDSRDWLETDPGQRWFYLNEGYVLLGGIIETVSGSSYEDYIGENIFKPLGMERTCFSREEVENDDDAAIPYLVEGEERTPQDYLYGSITSDGGIISCAEDMARYLQLYIEGGGEGVISSDSLQEMKKPRIPTPARTLYQRQDAGEGVEADYSRESRPRYYGYGLAREDDFLGYSKVGHGGSVLVSTAQMDFIPEEELGVVILANGSGYPLSQLSSYTLAVLLDEDPDRLHFRRAEIDLEKLTGRYEAYKGNYQLEIERSGDMLSLQNVSSSLGEKEMLIPDELGEKKLVFSALRGGRRVPVEFYRREDGIELLYGRYKLKKTPAPGD